MIWKRFSIVFLLACSISLTGCLSHWFLESETRLQVENATEDLSIVAIDVVAEDSTQARSWIHEKILPGERSHVVASDWVGEFNLRIKYVDSKKSSSDTLIDFHKFDFDGGSYFLVVSGDEKSLDYRFR